MKTVGVKSLDDLVERTVPHSILLDKVCTLNPRFINSCTSRNRSGTPNRGGREGVAKVSVMLSVAARRRPARLFGTLATPIDKARIRKVRRMIARCAP